MTIEEAIEIAEEVAEENQKVVDTGIVFDDVTIDMLYCDDTEVIEEHLANYQRCAEEHRQLAEWLRDYKRLKEQESFINKPSVSGEVCEHDKNVVLDKIKSEVESIERYGTNNGHDIWLKTPEEIKKDVLAIIDEYKEETEDDKQ